MSRLYNTKKEYIEMLGTVLGARDDFKQLAYYKHPSNGEEYLALSSLTGEVFMFDITGYSERQIFHTIAKVECDGLNVGNLITDIDKRLEIGKLFN